MFRRALGIALVAGCSSTIEGTGGPAGPPDAFFVAVGAEVTLTFKRGCAQANDGEPKREGCLEEPIDSLAGVSLSNSGPFVVLGSELARTGEVTVRLRANAPGDATLKIDQNTLIRGPASSSFLVSAREITDVREHVNCQWPDPPSRRYPIARGSTWTTKLTAMNETTPLLSGAMELVLDRGGLEILDEPKDGSVRRVQTPDAPGTHVWRVAGTRATPITFDVFDPQNVSVDVSETGRGIAVRPAIGGVPICINAGNGRAAVRVVDGTCSIHAGVFDVEGDMPVSFTRGGATIEIGGTGACTVEAAMTAGGTGSDRITVQVPTDPLSAVKPTGNPLSATPTEIGGVIARHGACTRVSKIGNGKCEAINAGGYVLPDGDCFSSWHWKINHIDGDGTVIENNGPLGVGLSTELRLSLEFSVLLIGVARFSPNNLRFEPAPPAPLVIDRIGCDGTSYEALGVKVTAEGAHLLRWVADNAPGPDDYTFDARPISRITYLEAQSEALVVGPTSRTKYFAGSEADLAIKYLDAGGRALRGVAPFRASASDPSALLAGKRLYVGRAPNTISLSSAVAASEQVIDVIDTPAVDAIAGFGTNDVKSVLEERCIDPFPRSGGVRVYGKSPTRPKVSFEGTGCAFGPRSPWAGLDPRGQLCLAFEGTGTTSVRMTWGQGSGTWVCAAR
jgi:hypothetical protein